MKFPSLKINVLVGQAFNFNQLNYTSYKYKRMSNRWNDSHKPPKLISGCLVPLLITIIIVGGIYLLAKKFGWD